MSDSVTVDIRGKEEFQRTLLALVRALPNDKVEPVMLDGAKVVARDAKSRAPVGPTGNLKRAVRTRQLRQIGRYPRTAIAAVDRKKAPHAHLIEYGTKPRVQKTTGRPTGIGPAIPFFRPAVDTNRVRVYEQIKDKLWEMILQAAGR